MAEALASAAGPPVEPGGDCEQVGAPLRCFELEATSARRRHQELHGSLHGGDHADLDGSNGSSGQHADPDLPEGSIGVRTPLRPSSLRGGRPERSHLRPVRFQGGDPQGSDDPSAAQSKSSCSNPSTIAGAHLTTQQKQSRRQSIKQSRRQERSPGKVNWFLRTATFWLGTFLAFLSGLLLGTTSVSELGQHDAFAELDSSADPATASRGPGATSTSRDWSPSGGASSATFGADGQGEGDSSYAFDFDGTSAGDSFGQRFSGELGSGWLAMEPGLEQPFELGPALRLDRGDRGAARGLRERPGELPGHGPGTDVPGRFGSLNPQLSGSADRPLTFEDRGFQLLKPGRRKRLLHTARQLRQLWLTELQIYDNVIQAARKLRHTSEVDLIEIYGGHCNITEEALSRGLRCLQPVDKIHGISLNSKADFAWLQRLLHRWRPLLTVLEPECRLWSPLTGLNYYWRPEELEQLREEAQVTVEGVANMIRDIIAADRFFLLENPHNGQFWNQPAMLKLFNDFELYYDYGNMCAYGLRGRNGGLICKPTGWLSNNPALLASVTHKCNGLHEHEECMGGNAKLAAVYTKQLAKSLVDAFTSEMQDLGDERFILATSASSSATSFPTSSSSRRPTTPSRAPLTPMPGTPMPGTPAWPVPSTPGPGPMLEDDHVSLQKDPDSWRPLLKEAAERLEGKVAVAAEIKPSAFLEQVKALVPWHISFAQIYRTPKTRRLPTQRMLNVPDITHRGAALLYHDNTIEVESQALEDLTNPNSRFERSVRVAIFIYGKPMAVETSAQRRTLSKLTSPPTPVAVEPEQTMKPWEPGAADISFPGLSEDQVPRWMQNVLKRNHSNLGHPSSATLIRMLSQAQASPAALISVHVLCVALSVNAANHLENLDLQRHHHLPDGSMSV